MHSSGSSLAAARAIACVAFVSTVAALSACGSHGRSVPPDESPPGATGDAPALNTLTESERAEGWRLLFDGKTTAGWRGYKKDSMPDGWQAIDGELTRVAPAGDIITVDQFGDFELALEWKVEPGGNSGIFYRVTE